MHRPLTIDDLRAFSPLLRIGASIDTLATVDSTNAYLLRRAEQLRDGAIATAEFQDQGRGRLGRKWLAPRGSSILLSVFLLERGDSALLANAAMLGCVAACEAIELATDCTPAVRWPNDLTVGARKIGGVLAEATPILAQADARGMVLGIGVNCLQHAGHFPPELSGKATSLELESAHAVSRSELAGRLVQRLDCWIMRMSECDGVATLRSAWLERCADRGQRATLMCDGLEHRGTILDIGANGDLVVQLDCGARKTFAAATCSRHW